MGIWPIAQLTGGWGMICPCCAGSSDTIPSDIQALLGPVQSAKETETATVEEAEDAILTTPAPARHASRSRRRLNGEGRDDAGKRRRSDMSNADDDGDDSIPECPATKEGEEEGPFFLCS